MYTNGITTMRTHKFNECRILNISKEVNNTDDVSYDLITGLQVDNNAVPPHVITNLLNIANECIASIEYCLPTGMILNIGFTMLPEHVDELAEA